jgi:hypothetical protein
MLALATIPCARYRFDTILMADRGRYDLVAMMGSTSCMVTAKRCAVWQQRQRYLYGDDGEDFKWWTLCRRLFGGFDDDEIIGLPIRSHRRWFGNDTLATTAMMRFTWRVW